MPYGWQGDFVDEGKLDLLTKCEYLDNNEIAGHLQLCSSVVH